MNNPKRRRVRGWSGGGRGGLNGPNYSGSEVAAAAHLPGAALDYRGLAMTNAIFQGEKMDASKIFYAAGANTKLDSFELAAEKSLKLQVAVKSEAGHARTSSAILEGGDPVKKNE